MDAEKFLRQKYRTLKKKEKEKNVVPFLSSEDRKRIPGCTTFLYDILLQ
jgi:hypothetical protein